MATKREAQSEVYRLLDTTTLTLTAIAQRTDYTRERVRQLERKRGGNSRRKVRLSRQLLCRVCGRIWTWQPKKSNYAHPVRCPECKAARRLVAYVELICPVCHEHFEVIPSQVPYRVHCSNKCKGTWLGRTYGFRRMPDPPLTECLGCGIAFVPPRDHRHQKFHNRDCYVAYVRRQRAEWLWSLVP